MALINWFIHSLTPSFFLHSLGMHGGFSLQAPVFGILAVILANCIVSMRVYWREDQVNTQLMQCKSVFVFSSSYVSGLT